MRLERNGQAIVQTTNDGEGHDEQKDGGAAPILQVKCQPGERHAPGPRRGKTHTLACGGGWLPRWREPKATHQEGGDPAGIAQSEVRRL